MSYFAEHDVLRLLTLPYLAIPYGTNVAKIFLQGVTVMFHIVIFSTVDKLKTI